MHTKLTSRLGRRRARFLTLSAIVLAASLVGFPSFSAADAHGGGGQGPWTASLRVLNRTHLKLRLVDKTKTENRCAKFLQISLGVGTSAY